jgi:hypothetical protein
MAKETFISMKMQHEMIRSWFDWAAERFSTQVGPIK